ncbi:MAG TPA: vWA domain-containing protein [Myxococcota bacterium]|nr:vWA domain-containing protein [Myxococcota bacterium]
MKQADVVVITDGESHLEAETVEAANMLTRVEGVSWFVIGVGSNAGKRCATSLAPIATDMVHVARLDDPVPVVDVVNLERKEAYLHEWK